VLRSSPTGMRQECNDGETKQAKATLQQRGIRYRYGPVWLPLIVMQSCVFLLLPSLLGKTTMATVSWNVLCADRGSEPVNVLFQNISCTHFSSVVGKCAFSSSLRDSCRILCSV
jgi:hypothetical protein